MKLNKTIVLITSCFLLCFVIADYVFSADYNNSSANMTRDSLYSKEFITHLVKCQYYKEESRNDFFGTVITSVVQVNGWKNGKCEYVNYAKEIPSSKTNCNFTRFQLNEILAASKKDPNTQETYNNGMMTYKADPLSVLFTKFMNDSSTCVVPN